MSYLKLDRTKINYISPSISRGGIILSQIIESECSPENPVLVSSVSELDLYFGRSFIEREYFEELLTNDVTLLLTNPKKPEYSEVPEIDISEYEIVGKVIDSKENILLDIQYSDQLPSPPSIKDEKKYQEFLGEVKNRKYYVSSEGEYYIFYQDEWISESLIPKSILPGSFSNRDTLRLTNSGWSYDVWKGENKLPWCWPKYSSQSWTPEYNEKPNEESLINSLKNNSIEDEEMSLGFILDFSGITESIKKRDDFDQTYLVVPVSTGSGRIQFYVGEEKDSLPPEFFYTEPDGRNKIRIPTNLTLEEQIKIIISTLEENGWTCHKEEKFWKLYSTKFLPDLRFYNIPGLEFHKDLDTSHNILSILSERHKRIEFFSKTIGKGDDELKVGISKIEGKKEWYRVTLSKYDYQEIYEGPLYLEVDKDTNIYTSLEKSINQGSNLVRVKVYPSWSYINEKGEEVYVKFSKDNSGDGLPEGSYILSRSIPQSSWTPDDYWRAMGELSEFGVSEDFLMIPRIENYLREGVKSGESWYSEYKDLLDYANLKNCQVLISNHPYYFGYNNTPGNDYTSDSNPEIGSLYLVENGAKVYKGENTWETVYTSEHPRWKEVKDTLTKGYTGNQIFNYLIKGEDGKVVKDLDPENRLVYFYQDMTYYGWSRPAWYVFLRGILSGNYFIETNDIVYSSPSKYYTEENYPGLSLESCKSNFLSDNGHIYYYRKFFSHPGNWEYTNSILSRFCMDKVSNTVSRDFSAYLSKETTGEIIKGLNGILSKLRSRYSIIYSLDIDNIEEDTYNQKISVYLNLGIRETLDKDVKLSVTLNFNFT